MSEKITGFMRNPNPLRRRDNEVATFASDGIEGVAVAALKYDYEQMDEGYRREASAAAREINASGKRVSESVLRIGRKLSEVKALLPHGQFEDWCSAEFGYSKSTVEGFMRIHAEFKDKPQVFDLFSFTALRQLSSPSVSDDERIEVLKIAKGTVQTEGKMGKKGVEKIIQESRKYGDLHEKSVSSTLLPAPPAPSIASQVIAPPAPSVAGQVIALAEDGMVAEVATVLAQSVSTLPAETEAYYEDDEIVLPAATTLWGMSDKDAIIASQRGEIARLTERVSELEEVIRDLERKK